MAGKKGMKPNPASYPRPAKTAEAKRAQLAGTAKQAQANSTLWRSTGVGGNPGGKTVREKGQQRGRLIAERIRVLADEVIGEGGNKTTRLDALLRRLFAEAIGGKISAAELLLDRGYGRVPATVELDIQSEVRQIVMQSGVPLSVLKDDPYMRMLLEAADSEDLFVEGEVRLLEDAIGNRPQDVQAVVGQDTDGTDSAED